ncbi:E3 ubiquitin-protein ligase TRIM39-like isoform X2 [Mauremys mutica]|uniref:E3 ubiquitin-protein ligase TRIM39-like isoform X2 n=1 Tax=Mauremys mutica TaxID=74926 RepID=UPI001D1601B2|nr:E3 ubiquitin-protein ligase TRIM39-like isoform X2 [Mauremys mutica]
MATDNPVESLQEEATCPICLEYFKDPVIIDCGHNFCQACIAQCWEGSNTDVSCPQCRETVQQGNLRPNRQLANVVEMVKRLSLQAPKGAGEERVCGEHQETLKLFCEEDQTSVCVVCHLSRAHRDHRVVPIKEAAQEYKVKLQGALGPLRKELEEALALMSAEEEKTTEWQDVKSTLSRSENVKLQEPEAVSTDLKNVYKISLDMREALQRFGVDVTLDPDTANPNLILSDDRKRVRDGDTCQDLPENPERFDYCYCVLGTEGFTGGRRYWEVEVGDKPDWDLGVCRESVSRKGQVTLSPEDGYWAVVLRDGEYEACSSPSAPLPVSVRPIQVGIFLDYEAGEVSFYNVTDRSHLFTFTDTFSGTLRPFLSPCDNAEGTNVAPLIICPVPAQAGGNLSP